MSEKPSMILSSIPGNAPLARGMWAIGYWSPTEKEATSFTKLQSLLKFCGVPLMPDLPVMLPRPQDFVDSSWDRRERSIVAQYLRRGSVLERYFGYSTCRFEKCDASDVALGDADLTDGVYVWPEGFVHYLLAHDVRPPVEFVRHVLSRSEFAR